MQPINAILSLNHLIPVYVVYALLTVACSPTGPENTPPSVSITLPIDGISVEVGDVVDIVAEAADSDGVVTSVSFYVGRSVVAEDSTRPYEFSWNTESAPGYYNRVRVSAKDDAGDSTMAAVTVYTSYRPSQPERVDDGWGTGTLESAGLDPDPFVTLMNSLRDQRNHRVHSILVAVDGIMVFEEYFDGLGHPTWGETPKAFDRETVHGLSSVTKSFTATLLGIAIYNGYISSVEEPVFDYFPELSDLNVGNKGDITLEHMVTMTSGLEWDEWSYSLRDSRNYLIRFLRSLQPLRFVLEQSMVAEPGTTYEYSGGNTNVLGEAIARATGMGLDDFSDQYLFDPLGIDDYSWIALPFSSEITYASGDLRMRPRDMLKVGQMYLQRGVWNGERIISEEWVDASAESYINVPGWAAHWLYSYGWWPQRGRYGEGAFAASGWGQQTIIVLPEFNMVAVFTGGSYWDPPPMTWDDMMLRYVLPSAESSLIAQNLLQQSTTAN